MMMLPRIAKKARFTTSSTPALINACAALIEDTEMMLERYLLAGKDHYDYLMSTTKKETARKLDTFLKSAQWQENIAQWSKLKVYFLMDEKQTLQNDGVYILIKRDSEGLPTLLRVTLRSAFASTSFDADLADVEKTKKCVEKYKLTYYHDFATVVDDVTHLEVMLAKSNISTRGKLLAEFNLKWNGQLDASHSSDCLTNTGHLSIRDAAGRIIHHNKINLVHRDQNSFTSAPVVRARPKERLELPPPVGDSSNVKTDRHDLRITGQKRSYKV